MIRFIGALFVLQSALLAATCSAQSLFAPITKQMGITQQLGSSVPTNVEFLDEQGRTVTLGTYLGKDPVLLVPIFYTCKTGCAMITDGLVQTLMKANQPTGVVGMVERKSGNLPLQPGKAMDIVMVSIDPRETPALAADKKNQILNTMDSRSKEGLAKLMGSTANLADEMSEHLHLLTGTLPNILKVTDSIGFKYHFNPQTGIIDHPTGSVILTPKGVISSYTIGNDFPTRMLETSLALAAKNEVSPKKADQSFMFGCIMIEPGTEHIRFVVENIVRVVCVLFLLGFGFGIYRMIRNDRQSPNRGGESLDGFSPSH